MGKLIGLLLIVAGIWVGLEVYQNGVGGAFGGVLAGASAEAAPAPTAPQRAGAAVGRAHGEADARREKLLTE
jgi:hypothetical protein